MLQELKIVQYTWVI